MADEKKFKNSEGVEAKDAVAPFTSDVDAEAQKRAEDAGVVAPQFVDYEAALETYQQRSDIETLEARRARSNGGSFGAASFRRETGGAEDAGGGVITSDEATADADPKKVAKQDKSDK